MCVDRLEQASEPFPIVKRKDEEKRGEHPKKRLVLEGYDGLTHEGASA